MNKKMLRIATVGAVTSVAVSGMTLAAAAPASAAPIKDKITISAPPSVEAGSTFTVNCRAKMRLRGSVVLLVEKSPSGRGINYFYDFKNRNCTMEANAYEAGTHTLFIKVKKNGKVFKSNVVKFNVN